MRVMISHHFLLFSAYKVSLLKLFFFFFFCSHLFQLCLSFECSILTFRFQHHFDQNHTSNLMSSNFPFCSSPKTPVQESCSNTYTHVWCLHFNRISSEIAWQNCVYAFVSFYKNLDLFFLSFRVSFVLQDKMFVRKIVLVCFQETCSYILHYGTWSIKY